MSPVQNALENEEDLKPVRTTKYAILICAINHIGFLQQNTRRLILETEKPNKRLKALKKLVSMSVEKYAKKQKTIKVLIRIKVMCNSFYDLHCTFTTPKTSRLLR